MPYEIEGLTLLDQTTIEAVTKMQTWASLIVALSAFFAFVFIIAALVCWGDEMSHAYLDSQFRRMPMSPSTGRAAAPASGKAAEVHDRSFVSARYHSLFSDVPRISTFDLHQPLC